MEESNYILLAKDGIKLEIIMNLIIYELKKLFSKITPNKIKFEMNLYF